MTPRPRPLGFAAMMIRSQRRHEDRMARVQPQAGAAIEAIPAHLLAPRRAVEQRTA